MEKTEEEICILCFDEKEHNSFFNIINFFDVLDLFIEYLEKLDKHPVLQNSKVIVDGYLKDGIEELIPAPTYIEKKSNYFYYESIPNITFTTDIISFIKKMQKSTEYLNFIDVSFFIMPKVNVLISDYFLGISFEGIKSNQTNEIITDLFSTIFPFIDANNVLKKLKENLGIDFKIFADGRMVKVRS
jgi:hypothetical protein